VGAALAGMARRKRKLPPQGGPLKAGQAVRPDNEIHAGGLSGKRIGVAAAGEVDARRQRAEGPPALGYKAAAPSGARFSSRQQR